MESDEKYEIEAPLQTDIIVNIANNVERRVEAVKKIKGMALRMTNFHDWTDQGGKCYLQVSGAEKVARLFGISWRFLGDIVRKDEADGHFSFEVPMEFLMSGISIQFIGSRSSKDPFFSRKKGVEVPPSEIDKTDVMKAAITNTIGNGITRILGIRNLTWDDLKEAGIDVSKVSRVTYREKDQSSSYGYGDPLPNPPESGGTTITEPQVKRFYALAKSTGAQDSEIKEWLVKNYGWNSTRQITREKYDEVCKAVVQALGPQPPEEEDHQ